MTNFASAKANNNNQLKPRAMKTRKTYWERVLNALQALERPLTMRELNIANYANKKVIYG